MQNTSNFNFNLPEGTDLWNYLTQTNPNFTSLDTLLKSIQDGTVTTATEVTSGTAHAVTRTLPDANVIRFTATGVWTLGDTMTIDGTPVTVVKPNGTSLQTGDYIIGSEVLGVLRATQFTVYVGGASSLDAADVTYDNTVSGLTAADVQAAIDEEAAAINTINSNLVEIGDYTLLADFSNTTATNITLSDNLNNYRAIILVLSHTTTPTQVRNTTILPVGVYKTRLSVGTSYVGSAGGSLRYWNVIANYVDDTTINAVATTDYSSQPSYGLLYGIK